MLKRIMVFVSIFILTGTVLMSAEDVTISGKIVDISNNDLPEVSVVISGTNYKTITDNSGDFTLKIPEDKIYHSKNNYNLVVSKAGYSTQIVGFHKPDTSIKIKLKPITDNTGFVEYTEEIPEPSAFIRWVSNKNRAVLKDGKSLKNCPELKGKFKEGVKQTTIFRVHLPENAKEVNGIFFISEHGVGQRLIESRITWEFANKYSLALIGVSGYSVQCGMYPDDRLDNIISKIGTKLKHPELATVPVITFGHSNGTAFSGIYAAMRPERTIGWISYHSGESWHLVFPGVEKSPGLVMHGLKDRYFKDQQQTIEKLRSERNAPIAIMMEANVAHWPKDYNSTYQFILAFCESCINTRFPDGFKNKKMLPVNIKSGWLSAQYDLVKGGLQSPYIASYSEYKGDKSIANWLPDKNFAEIWKAYSATEKVPKH
jgi:phage pi2 protein 07